MSASIRDRNIARVVKTVSAKLVERGMTRAGAEVIAIRHAQDALAYFQARLIEAGGWSEAAYERADRELATWAAGLTS